MNVPVRVLSAPASRAATEHTFRTSDGVELFYRAWEPNVPSAKGVVLFHRGHEHSGRWQDFVDRLDMRDAWCFAWDARGHGRSPGERGHAESFARMVKDADEFVRHLSETHGIDVSDMAVVAQSVGAVLAATWVHDYAPPIRALVVATPAFKVKLYVPFAIPALRVLNKVKRRAFIRSYVKPRMLTHDPQQAAEYAGDPLISPQIAVNILLDLFDTSRRLIADAGAIHTPTLLLVSGSDFVVHRRPQTQFFERLSSAVKVLEEYPGFFHSTFWERDRDLPIGRTRKFLQQQFESPAPAPNLLHADREGYTKQRYDTLQQPLTGVSPQRINFAAQSAALRTVAKLSKGVQIGWRSGFDSGQSLDHVYRDRAEGITPVGRIIDRVYLDSPGWRGIRRRKVHLRQMLNRVIDRLAEEGRTIRIVDIAAGPGRYVLETIQAHPEKSISALLCDRDRGGLEAGRRLAAEMRIASVEYQEGDAFDRQRLASLRPRPTIAIVSGLYELFPENAPVRESLAGLAEAMEPGAFLIYTNQPWHPQQEMIARCLPNRDGKPWVMRCRTQAEMDQLVAAAGFAKVDQLIDEAGIFSVSLGVRSGPAE